MQFEQQADGTRLTLPKPSIDTGMGLERIAAVMQGVHDNYDIDTFKALIAASESLTGVRAEGATTASHRVIADHLRSTSFLLADGVLPSNEGRGYVLRRIMRRAMRHAHLLGAKQPLMHRLVPALITEMGAAYPELGRAQPLIQDVLEREETKFRQTLDKGLKLLDEATLDLSEGGTLPGETAFKLYDTYGFPYDLTEDALRSRGIAVDKDGFDTAMAQQKAAARAWKGSGEAAAGEVWFDIAERVGATEFTGYTSTTGEAQVVAIVKGGQEVTSAAAGDDVTIITNQTPFYGESGGQMGDAGTITGADGLSIAIADTAKPLGRLHAHSGKVESGSIKVGDAVVLAIDVARRDAIRANHSATHLLHAALRNRLGGHVTQKGSLVAPDRLRFDFSQPTALTAADIAAIEAEVNAEIRANDPVNTRLMSPEDAIEAGAMALFGEKYGEEVRVLSMGSKGDHKAYSVELCGGTHVRALGDIGVLRVVSESAVSSGIRRIEALTGEGARQWLVHREDQLKGAASILRTTPDEVEARVTALLDERKKLERELAEAKKALALGGGGGAAPAADETVNGVTFSGQVIDGLDAKELRGLLDQAKQRMGSGVAVIVAVNEGKASIAAAVTADLTERVSAVDLVRAGVEALGGKGGGGRADMAQGGGPDGSKGAEAIAAVKAIIAG
jgi:alanyl-tRNA synthetase